MHDALAVRGIQGIGHGEGDVHEDRDLYRAASEPMLERLAFEQLHRDERRIGADIVDGADIGVIERRGRSRFPLETFQRLRRRGDPVRQDFDRHDPFETRVRGPIHFAHPAGAERADDFVRAEASAGSKGQARSSLANAVSLHTVIQERRTAQKPRNPQRRILEVPSACFARSAFNVVTLRGSASVSARLWPARPRSA